MSSQAKSDKRGDAQLLKELLAVTESFTKSASWIWILPENTMISSPNCRQLFAAEKEEQIAPTALMERMKQRDKNLFQTLFENLQRHQVGIDDEFAVLDYAGNWQSLRIIATIEKKNSEQWQVNGLYQIVLEEPDQIKSFATMQREYILKVLKQTGGRVSGPKGAARLLDINSKTLFAKMKKLGINKEEYYFKKD